MAPSTSRSKTMRHRNKQLKLGPGTRCAGCSEADLRALQRTELVLCAECRLALSGKATSERHHPAGRHNDPFQAPFPANAHAILTDAQRDWPRETFRNPDRDFFLTLAAWLRFFADTFCHLAEVAMEWAAELERRATHVTQHLGPRWWTAMEEGS